MPEITHGASGLPGTIEGVFGPDGVLAHHLAGFEPRPGQERMAAAVAGLLKSPDEPGCLVIEAEIGLGKTLAYLVPAVLSGRRVVISTNTRNLQDQILKREIPFIQQYIEPALRAMSVKGRQNYLCVYRWHQYRAARRGGLFDDEAVGRIETWIEETEFGDRAELGWLRGGAPLWQQVCCQTHSCLGRDCPDSAVCFLNRLRRRAAKCNILVVNHHLLFSDLAVRRSGYGEVLPRYESVIFDEAHHVENVATLFFGYSFSRLQVLDLAGDVERNVQAEPAGTKQKELLRIARSLGAGLEDLVACFPARQGRFPLAPVLEQQPEINSSADSLVNAFGRLADLLDELAGREAPWGHFAVRARDLAGRLASITLERFTDMAPEEIRAVHWYERREKNLILSATPVDVADDLRETLFASVPHAVFTSATLAAGGDFRYFCRRLGLSEETPTLSFPSPFDYESRTLLYVPDGDFPAPQDPGYASALHDRIRELVEAAGGRALVLFTSIKAMEQAYQVLSDSLDFPLFLQGSGPRHDLLTRFGAEEESVLFGTSSFWEGVDIPGASLSLVIIDKLPFEVPSDPVMMARMEMIRAAGGNPFFDFQVPRAVLALRQGVGRLMRSSTDRGVMAVLDVRLFTRGYGRRFFKSLPPSPVCRDLERVRCFLMKMECHDQA